MTDHWPTDAEMNEAQAETIKAQWLKISRLQTDGERKDTQIASLVRRTNAQQKIIDDDRCPKKQAEKVFK